MPNNHYVPHVILAQSAPEVGESVCLVGIRSYTKVAFRAELTF